jgi:hypothetical protein
MTPYITAAFIVGLMGGVGVGICLHWLPWFRR